MIQIILQNQHSVRVMSILHLLDRVFSIDSDLLISFALIHVVGSYSIRTIACIQHQHFTFIVRPSSKVSCLKNRIIGFERIISVKFVNLKLKNIWKNL